MTTVTPPDLRAAIAADLRPTRPLPAPSRRSLAVLPVAIAILVGIPVLHRFRYDLALIGVTRAWVLSFAQSIAGISLVALGLRESVPGREIPRRTLTLAIGAGLLLPVLILAITAQASFLGSRPGLWWIDSIICFRVSALGAAPALLMSAALAARAYPLRPAVAGALYGLGSGLIADAGLRLYCEYSVPGHVLIAHGGAIVLSTIAGMAVAVLLARRR